MKCNSFLTYHCISLNLNESEWLKDRMIFVAGCCAEDELIFAKTLSFFYTHRRQQCPMHARGKGNTTHDNMWTCPSRNREVKQQTMPELWAVLVRPQPISICVHGSSHICSWSRLPHQLDQIHCFGTRYDENEVPYMHTFFNLAKFNVLNNCLKYINVHLHR
jgi:hypothetical protein